MRLVFLLCFLCPTFATIAAGLEYDESSNVYLVSNSWSRRIHINKVFDKAPPQFLGQIIKKIAMENRLNLIASPVGVSLALSLLKYGASGDTKEILNKAIGLSYCDDCARIGLQGLVDQLNGYSSVQMNVVTSAFFPSGMTIYPEFATTCMRVFRSPVRSIDFTRLFHTKFVINNWFADETSNRITEPVSSADINGSTGVVLVNAVYFKGKWQEKFDTRLTQNRVFNCVNSVQRSIPFMSGKRTVRYGFYPEVRSRFIELPFASEDNARDMSMFIILPVHTNGLDYLEANFHEITVEKLLSRGSDEKMHIYLPKFKIENKLDLVEPLKQMNMSDLFDQNKSNLSEIMVPLFAKYGKYATYVSKMIQKAVIEINEDGNEAPPPATVRPFSLPLLMQSVNLPIFYPPRPSPENERFITFDVNYPFYAIVVLKSERPLNILTTRFTGIET